MPRGSGIVARSASAVALAPGIRGRRRSERSPIMSRHGTTGPALGDGRTTFRVLGAEDIGEATRSRGGGDGVLSGATPDDPR